MKMLLEDGKKIHWIRFLVFFFYESVQVSPTYMQNVKAVTRLSFEILLNILKKSLISGFRDFRSPVLIHELR